MLKMIITCGIIYFTLHTFSRRTPLIIQVLKAMSERRSTNKTYHGSLISSISLYILLIILIQFKRALSVKESSLENESEEVMQAFEQIQQQVIFLFLPLKTYHFLLPAKNTQGPH